MSQSPFTLVAVADQATVEAAELLIREYLTFINETALKNYQLTFDIEAMIASDVQDQDKFHPPSGRFYLLRDADQFVGVGCLKRLESTVAEIQRMYVQPHVRGRGAGRLLLDRLLSDARAIGYKLIRLESLRALTAAHTLYRSVGFKDIDPYQANSMREYQPSETLDTYRSSAVFMELVL